MSVARRNGEWKEDRTQLDLTWLEQRGKGGTLVSAEDRHARLIMDYVSLPISVSSRINNPLPVLNMSWTASSRTTAACALLGSPSRETITRRAFYVGLRFDSFGPQDLLSGVSEPVPPRATGSADGRCTYDWGQRWFWVAKSEPLSPFFMGMSYLWRREPVWRYGKELSDWDSFGRLSMSGAGRASDRARV